MAKKLTKAKNGIPYKSDKDARSMMESYDIRDRKIAEGKRKPLTPTERIVAQTPLDPLYMEALRGKMKMQGKLKRGGIIKKKK
jgi:hypothetical protein